MGGQNSTNIRSESVSLIQLYVPLEVTKQTLFELGELGLVEFRDLNFEANAFERPYIKDVTRLEEYEQKITYIWQKIKGANLYMNASKNDQTDVSFYKQQELELLETTIDEYYTRLKKIDDSLASFGQSYAQFSVKARILREVQGYLRHDSLKDFTIDQHVDEPTELSRLTEQGTRAETNITMVKFLFIAGVIQRKILPVFEQIVFRVLRGNSFMQFSEIPEEVTPTGEKLSNMVVFAIFLHGKEVLKKMEKICSLICFVTMKIDCYYNDIAEEAKEYERKCEDLNSVIANIKNTLLVELTNASERINSWWNIIIKEKAIYTTLSMFKVDKSTNRNTLIGEGWCPSNSIETVRDSLRNVASRTGSSMCPFISVFKRKGMVLPTYIKTSEFTNPAQQIVNSFSVPAYREVNPGLFTIVTFPFLFSLMFGDAGHGAALAAFALWIIWRAKKYDAAKAGELYSMIHNGRYLLLLMGLFSVYSGLIYSDALSLPLQIFKSGWSPAVPGESARRSVGVYWFGIDYAWHHASNSIIFINSYKMKISIIIGVIHMVGGILINLINYVHFKQQSRIYTEFIPQILFMLCIFGYLAFIIVLKWCMRFPRPETAPSLLSIMISMVLSPTSLPAANRLYSGQAVVQPALMLIAVLCVPWMLLSGPIYEHYIKKGKGLRFKGSHQDDGAAGGSKAGDYVLVKADNINGEETPMGNGAGIVVGDEVAVPIGVEEGQEVYDDSASDAEKEVSFSEELIYKSIHTIEFCLNALSNTASYLRIWALSLAHSELSKINWSMLMGGALSREGPSQVPLLIIAFPAWLILTIAILICMEGLSAFLHTLRLHWIEFHSKFYMGNGVQFAPLSFQKILSESKKT